MAPHPEPAAPPSAPTGRPPTAPAADAEPPRGRAAEEPGTPLEERIRGDWQTVRRGFADAGEDFKRALESLRHNLRETFGR